MLAESSQTTSLPYLLPGAKETQVFQFITSKVMSVHTVMKYFQNTNWTALLPRPVPLGPGAAGRIGWLLNIRALSTEPRQDLSLGQQAQLTRPWHGESMCCLRPHGTLREKTTIFRDAGMKAY